MSVGIAPSSPVVFTCIPNREDRSIDIAVIGTTIYDNSEDGYPKSWGDPDANARLIAAAPELLVALKMLLEDGTLDQALMEPGRVSIARAAIAKAEGR
jgi:hypothetical protein